MPFAQEPDCGPGRVLYCAPGVQLVRAATATQGVKKAFGVDFLFALDMWLPKPCLLLHRLKSMIEEGPQRHGRL
jgi:hypothetical protein